MKESIGATQLFMIVIVLVLLFSGIVAFSINRSNAFTVKEELVSIIEEAGSFNIDAEIYGSSSDDTLQKMVDVLSEYGYRQAGDCSVYYNNQVDSNSEKIIEVAGYQRNGQKTSGNNSSAFCVVKIKSNQNWEDTVFYYQVIVFYSLDIPIIKTILNFKEVGETKILYN